MQAIATSPLARRIARFVFGFTFALAAVIQFAEAVAAPAQSPHWVAAWAASAQGPYPVGNPTAQPELKFAFPDAARGAVDQSFRLIVRPDIWGKQARIRLSNAFGTQPVTFDGAYVALQTSGSAVLTGTSRRHYVRRQARPSPSRPARTSLSDAVSLPFVKNRRRPDADRPPPRRELSCRGRKRPDDVARQGAHHVLHHRAGRRCAWRRRGRIRVPDVVRLLVFPGRGRDDGAARRPA